MTANELKGIYSELLNKGSQELDAFKQSDGAASGVKLEFEMTVQQAIAKAANANSGEDAFADSAADMAAALNLKKKYVTSVGNKIAQFTPQQKQVQEQVLGSSPQAPNPGSHKWLYVGLGVGVLILLIVIVVGVLYWTGKIKFFDGGNGFGYAPISNVYAGQVWINETPDDGPAPLNVPWGVWPSWQTKGLGDQSPNPIAATGMSTQLPLSREIALPASEAIATGLQGPRGQSYTTPFVGVENPRLNRWYRYKTQG